MMRDSALDRDKGGLSARKIAVSPVPPRTASCALSRRYSAASAAAVSASRSPVAISQIRTGSTGRRHSLRLAPGHDSPGQFVDLRHHPAVPRSVVASTRYPAPRSARSFPRMNRQDGPKYAARLRRDQGPVDRLAGCTSPAAGMGGFTLSIRKSLAVGPLHRADDGAA
jgi:hypothetical protein